MIEIWYAILVAMLTAFLVLDGWNFGAGLLHFVVARSEEERRVIIAAIGLSWSWNEVWLIGFGGVLFVSFPNVMASAFTGFYLALFLLLWCLILRGISIEVRSHLLDGMWRGAWDFCFAASSLLLAALVGVALGNLVRGVPLDAAGKFTLPFFTDFGVRGKIGLLDWYTVSIAGFSVALLAAHGASYLTWKTTGVVHDRCERLAPRLWIAFLIILFATTSETAIVRPDLTLGLMHRPASWPGLALVIAGLALTLWGQRKRWELRSFLGSCATIVGLMSAGATGVFPVLLHSTRSPQTTLMADPSSTDAHSLRLALIWWPVSLVLALIYFVFIARNYRGKVAPTIDNQGYD